MKHPLTGLRIVNRHKYDRDADDFIHDYQMQVQWGGSDEWTTIQVIDEVWDMDRNRPDTSVWIDEPTRIIKKPEAAT